MKEQKRYDAIDGLRAFSAIGIALMHVLANGQYQLDGFIFGHLIPSFTDLVFLFMIISSFSMCCGYFDRIIHNQVQVEVFYKKRYAKIWPYFAMLCLLDFCISPSINSLYEVIANLTLCFGFLPNANIEVIGVGWFLGLIFVFYLIFPFFCFLMANRRRAWFSFAVAFVFHFLCGVYFVEAGRTNIVYSMVYFMAGGMIFLYRDMLSAFAGRFRWLIVVSCVVSLAAYFFIGGTASRLAFYALLLIYSIGGKTHGLLSNPVTKFLSGISMEIYLCHMVVYRGLEKLELTHLFETEILSYLFMAVGTVGGAVIFAKTTQWLLAKGQAAMKNHTPKAMNEKA